MYFARMSATAVQYMSVQGCSTHTVPLGHTVFQRKCYVKLTKVRSDFKRFLLKKGKKRISHLVLLFLTNT